MKCRSGFSDRRLSQSAPLWRRLDDYIRAMAPYVIGRSPHNIRHTAQVMFDDFAIRRSSVDFFCAWSAIVAACGFARRYLNADGRVRRYLTDAVFPVYIAHQTLIVLLAHGFKPLGLAPGLEAVLVMALTAGGSFALYEAVRRVAVLRPLFGLLWRADRPARDAAGRSAPAA